MAKNFDYANVELSPDDDFDKVNKLLNEMLNIDQSNVEGALAEGTKIFSVIQRLWAIHSRNLKTRLTQVKKIEMLRTRHYLGKLPRAHYEKDPLPESILKSDVDKYVAVDDLVIEMRALAHDSELIVTLIEDAKKTLTQRGWDIRAIIDLRKFNAGAH